jgi:hypothetical protein
MVGLAIIFVLVLGEVPELLSVARQVIHPKKSLLLRAVLVPCFEDVMNHSCPFLISRWLQGDCRKNGSEQRQIQNGGWGHAFLLLLFNSWT